MNDVYFQILSFFYIMKNDNLIKNFKSKFFTEPTIAGIFDTVKNFVIEYKTEPTAEQIIEILKADVNNTIQYDAVKLLWQSHDDIQKYSDDWLNENVIGWGKWQNFYKCSMEGTIAYVQTLNNISYTECDAYIQKASNIFNNGINFSVGISEGHDFFNVDNHIIPLEDTHTTGFKFVDLCLKGGFTKKGLYVFMGAPKVGKSMWLCNLAANSVKSGYNTIYITLEMSYQLVSQRIGSNLFDIPIDNYDKIVKDKNFMTAAMNKFNNNSIIPAGKFFIEEFPTSSATASDIEAFVLKKEAELSKEYGIDFKFDNVFIDYINIMKDQRGNSGGDNSYTKIKNICEDVRAVCQRNMWSGISLTQTNRTGMDASDLNMTNVSESSGLIATVDALFGIIQTTLMRASNVYYLKALALRNSPHMGDKKKFNFDPFHLRIEEDTNEEIIPDTVDIPAKYTSATVNAIANKKQGNNEKIVQQPIFGQYQAPNLNEIEDTLRNSQNALFGVN